MQMLIPKKTFVSTKLEFADYFIIFFSTETSHNPINGLVVFEVAFL